MIIQEIYDLAVEMGIKADPRGVEGVKRLFARTKKDYEELPEKRKKYFDRESFKNPYSDTRILYGDPKREVKKLMAGIDAEGTEVLLVDRLREKGERIDLLISHHPSGHALASLDEVMDIQVDIFAEAGVPVNVAHALFAERKAAIKRKISPINHSQTVDMAKILDVPLLAIHTVWDNLGHSFMEKYLAEKKFDTVGEILEYISEVPEFRESIKGKAGPFVVVGSEKTRAGKVIVNLTGGTTPSKELYVEMAKAGVGTLVEMHPPEEAVQELKKFHLNVIEGGHMASDSLGANLFLDELEKRGIKVIPCSGLIRVKRSS